MLDQLNFILPTPEEDEEINRGIALDPDTYEVSTEEIMQMRPYRSRLEADEEKQLTVQVDPAIVDTFKASGEGWQVRINDALKEWLKNHSLHEIS